MPATVTPDDVARPVEAEAFRVNLDLLSSAQLRDLVELYEALVRFMHQSNNELVTKAAERNDLTPGQVALLNRWSAANCGLHDGFHAEMVRIITRDFPETGPVQ